MMADYFLLLEGRNGVEVRRLSVSQGVADALEPIFQNGMTRLLAAELLPFDDPLFRPDESEALEIPDFALPEAIAQATENPLGVPEVSRNIQDEQVKGIFASVQSAEGQRQIAFQVMDKRSVLSARGLTVLLDRDTFRRLDQPGLTVGDHVHAVHIGNALVFKNLFWARRLFDLEDHFREATKEDVTGFMERPDIHVADEHFAETSSQWERKRVAFLAGSGILDACEPALVRETAAEYQIEIDTTVKNGQEALVIPVDKGARRKVLKFLEEDYYQGPLTSRQYEANSKRRMDR